MYNKENSFVCSFLDISNLGMEKHPEEIFLPRMVIGSLTRHFLCNIRPAIFCVKLQSTFVMFYKQSFTSNDRRKVLKSEATLHFKNEKLSMNSTRDFNSVLETISQYLISYSHKIKQRL